MTSLPPPIALSALLALGACTGPGEVQWAGGRAPLRTAFWQERPVEGGIHVVLALSTSEFPCELGLISDDPSEVALTQLELHTGACREGARHLVVDLWQRDGEMTGLYPGFTGGGASTLDDLDRFSTAGWFAVEEAGVQYIDGINRSYAPLEGRSVAMPDLGTGGEVRLDGDEAEVSGDLWFPEAGVSADFEAEECPAGPTLLDDLFDALALLEAVC